MSFETYGSNIVTNYIPKFNGNIFDDSLLKDDGTLTYNGDLINTVKEYNDYAGKQIGSDTLLEILESDSTTTLRGKLNYYNSAVTRVEDSTAPAGGCFELNNKYASITVPGWFKVEAGQEYTFEVWAKFISGTDTDQRIYAGSSFYDSSKTYLGNTQRYWGESGFRIDASYSNDGWYFISGTLGPTVGTGTGNIPTSARWMRLIMLLNYSDQANVIRLCGLRYYKSGGVGAKLHTSIYRKAIGSEAGTSAGAWLGRQVMDTSGNFYHPDNVKSYFGSSNDLEIYHDGSNSYIKDTGTGTLNLQGSTQVLISGTNGEVGVQYIENAGVGLRHNNVTKLTTESTGIAVVGDITFGDSHFIGDDSDDNLLIQGSANENIIINSLDELLFRTSGTTRLQISATDATFSGNINLPDNGFANFGASDDLRIYHDGSNSVIDTTTGSVGDLYLTANGTNHDLYLRAADNIYIQPQGGENGIILTGNGEVHIYHNSAKKIMTQSTGAIVYGTLELNDANTKLLEGNGNSLRIQTNSGYVDIGPNNTSWCHISTDRANFYFGQGASWNGHVLPYTNLTNDLGSTTNLWNFTHSRYFQSQGTKGRTKIRIWSGSTYGFGMDDGISFGGIGGVSSTDYCLTFQQSNTANRGWWFGDSAHTDAQGAFACTTEGRFTIAHSLRMGYGETDTTVPGTTYRLDVSGTIRATSDVIAFSDKRVKENIITINNALDKVTQLRGVTYTRKDIDDKSTKIGVIAQEVLEVLPEVVSIDNEDKHSVAYGNMAGVFIEAIKELKAEVDSLKQEIKQLKK